jgi:hypothetical protein
MTTLGFHTYFFLLHLLFPAGHGPRKTVGRELFKLDYARAIQEFPGCYRLCLTCAGGGPSPCPNVGNPQEAVAAFVRNRLASQARVFNAVYHLNSPLLRKAAGFATPGQTLESNSITVTGKVVDAACFMLYAAAASSASLRVRGCLCPLHASPAVCHVPAGSVPRNLRFGLPYHSHLSPNRQHRDAV